MCFTEFIGYTCGHTSLAVKRPCALTTKLFSNPACPGAGAVRPLLAETSCPACNRVMHGRCVNIIEHEHRFMHARGVCSCPVHFPYLMRPRVISPDDNVDINIEPAAAGAGAPAEAGAAAAYAGPSAVAGAGAGTGGNNSSGGMYATGLSGSAPVFTPSATAPAGTTNPSAFSLGPGPSSSFTSASWHQALIDGITSLTTSALNAGPSAFPSAFATAASERDNALALSSPDLSIRGRGGRRARSRRYRKNKQNQGDRRLSSSTTASSSNAGGPSSTTSGSSTALVPGSSQDAGMSSTGLAPLWEETQDAHTHRPAVAVRMDSLYGAEWLADHAVLHRDGRCSCDMSFDRYPAQYIGMLREEVDAEAAEAAASSAATTTVATTTATMTPTVGGGSNIASGNMHSYPYPHGGHGNSYYPNYGYSSGGTDVPAPPAPPPSPADVGASGYAQPQYQPQGQPQPHLSAQAQPQGQQNYYHPILNTRGNPNAPRPQPGHPGYAQPARLAYTPNNGSTQPADPARPIDMQTVWFNLPRDTPLAGLPLGCGPEGAPHYQPFENCELYYPRPSVGRSHSR
ncbi:hypothetical protein AAE478_001100 [Parahypoxylon ruwenzoriense]